MVAGTGTDTNIEARSETDIGVHIGVHLGSDHGLDADVSGA